MQRDTFWMISSGNKLIFYALAALSMIVFVYGIYRRYRLWQRGIKVKVGWSDVKTNFRFLLEMAVQQKKIKKDRLYGIMHRFTSYGFVILFIGTCLVFIDYDLGIPILRGNFYRLYEAVLDIFGVLFIIGLVIAMIVRARKQRPRLKNGLVDQLFLWLLLLIGIGGYILEGIRIGATQTAHGFWSPVGYMLSLLFRELPGFNAETYAWWWFSHALLAFVLIAIIPYTKLLHFLTAPINILFQSVKRTGNIGSAVLEGGTDVSSGSAAILRNATTLGNTATPANTVTKIYDFTNWQLLSTDACTECGRCESQCPAYQSEKPLSPRTLVLKIRDQMEFDRKIASFISADELQSCTTCGACVEACPVSINHIDLILAMRRGLIHDRVIEREAANTLMKLEEQHNPWGKPWSERAHWSRGLDIPVLEKEQGDRHKREGA
jgi:heterodisulfide reductase subunit C/nitrate reductase gamma subunit